jgi:hypothetical protein
MPPPDKEAMQPKKATATPGATAGKAVKDTVMEKKATAGD